MVVRYTAWMRPIVPLLVVTLAFAFYWRTGAPTVLTGDQAEHQMAAWMVGVPHATGYPLFTMLNAVAVRLLPFGDIARRVTLMTAVWSALAVLLVFLLVRRLSGNGLAGLVAAAALATSAEFWSLATIAEVYTLQALFILLIWWCLTQYWAAGSPRFVYAAAFVAGLATTHHGSFVPIVVPALLAMVAAPLLWQAWQRRQWSAWRVIGLCAVSALLGLMPWLYLATQYALFHPFDYYRGQGLPYHYYWGNPASWADVVNLAFGAGFRGEVFTHGWAQLPDLVVRFLAALRREFWWIAFVLGVVGVLVLPVRGGRDALFSALIFVCAALFGINVGANIPKAHVYFLPAYVIWSVWVGVGTAWISVWLGRTCAPLLGKTSQSLGLLASAWHTPHTIIANLVRWQAWLTHATLIGLFVATLLLGWRRFPTYNRSNDVAPYQLASAVLATVAPRAVILCRWELCMSIRYLQFIEHTRLDVQLDQTEPEAGVNWSERAALYAPGLPVYALGKTAELAAEYKLEPVAPAYDLWRVVHPR